MTVGLPFMSSGNCTVEPSNVLAVKAGARSPWPSSLGASSLCVQPAVTAMSTIAVSGVILTAISPCARSRQYGARGARAQARKPASHGPSIGRFGPTASRSTGVFRHGSLCRKGRDVMRKSVIAGGILAAVSCVPAAAQQQDMSQVQIRAVQIKPGVAVLYGNGGNIGVSYGADGTVLVDDQFAPLTEKIQAAVEGLGASPTKFLINTHWHFDHTGGNENFGKAGAVIMAHENVRVRLVAGGTVIGNVTPPAPPAALPVVTYGDGVTFHLNGDD